MASSAPPPSAGSTLGSSTSSGPSRLGWGSGSAFRGTGRGRGRGGRGGHHNGRSTGGKSTPQPTVEAAKKSPQDTKPKAPPPVSPQVSAAPPSAPPPLTPAASSKPSRPKPSRKSSEAKPSRKPTLTVDAAVPPANSSSSNSASPHTPSRRKRAHTHKDKGDKGSHAPPATATVVTPAPVPNIPRKASLPADLRNSSRPNGNKSTTPAAPAKDLPPHLAPSSAAAPTFDIRHDIDALVERVRAGAMDRPHTPATHIDWAGEDDDSLPDLDDWGITSSTTDVTTDSGKGSVMSPILQDSLKPLPSIIGIDTPSIKLHEVNGKESNLQGASEAQSLGDRTPRTDGGLETLSQSSTAGADADVEARSVVSADDARSTVLDAAVKVTTQASTVGEAPVARPSSSAESKQTTAEPAKTVLSPRPTKTLMSPKAIRPVPPPARATPDFFSDVSSPSPDRGLAASIHATSPPPSLLSPPPRVPIPPPRVGSGSGFAPTHARAQTVGRYADTSRSEHLSDSERPARRADLLHNGLGHGRNHSTPPGGVAGAHGHSRSTSRPVITGDAISRLARSLGGAALKRDSASAPKAPVP